MNLKIILIILLCFLIVYVSYKIYRYYKARQVFYEDLTDFCSYLRSQIDFLKMDLEKIINSKQKCYDREFALVLDLYLKTLKQNENFRQNFFEKLNLIKILKVDDKNKLTDFFEILGTTDLNNQLAQIENFKSIFLNEQKISKTENQNFGILSVKLGVLLACGIFIIFI